MMHKSVLLEESIKYLNIKENGVYVDATLGYGGHSVEILKKVKRGFLFAFDQDADAVKYSQERLQAVGSNFKIISDNFVNMTKRLKENDIDKVDGILFDLGVSSVQLDTDERGFSFHKDAKLDMRMDQSKSFSAYDVVNTYSHSDLVRIFRDYGEEKYASSVASRIIEYRENKPIETTLELVDIIRTGMPAKALRETHPGRRIFQAIRIEVNNELGVLENTIEQAIELLHVGGRMCVITFHSLEDRMVKNIVRKYSEIDPIYAKLPYIDEEHLPSLKIIKKKVTPSDEELEYNNRSRSAKLIVVEKIKG